MSILGGGPSPPATKPLQPKVAIVMATEGKAPVCLAEPQSARPQPNWKKYPFSRKDGAPVVGGYPNSMYVAKPKAIQGLVGPPPKPGQPQACIYYSV